MRLKAGRHARGTRRLRRAAPVLLALGLLAVATPQLAAGARTAGVQGIVPPNNPPANVAPSPNYDDCSESGVCSLGPPCYSASFAPLFDSASCEQEEVAAIDNARAKEGVGPIYLPSDFNSLTADEQLLVIIDLERVGRGLPPFAGIVASLDVVAHAGASVSGARAGSYEDPQFPPGFRVAPGTSLAYSCKSTGGNGYACYGSGEPGAAIAAGGQISALDADYGWMYDDGPGGANGDCTTPAAKGCWGHRDNILGRYPTRTQFAAATADTSPSHITRHRAMLVMGAGAQQPNGAGGPQGNFTAIFTSIVGRRPAFAYTWKQALAAGAGTPPA
jgi:hypothetical protein